MAQFTNQAQLTYNDSVINSNIAVGEILEVLSATKTAVKDTYKQYESITYIVSIVNSGTTPYTGLTLSDNLGEYIYDTVAVVPLTYTEGTVRYYINGVLQAAPVVTVDSDLIISGITVPANGNATIIYEVVANQYAPLEVGGTITNQVAIIGQGLTTVTAVEVVTVEAEPELSITKSISPVPVTENGTVTYTFLIQNTGNTAALTADNAVITDTFNPILSNLTVSFDDTTWTEGVNYTYDETTGVFTTMSGEITVPAATFTRNPVTGAVITNPGISTLVVTGTL